MIPALEARGDGTSKGGDDNEGSCSAPCVSGLVCDLCQRRDSLGLKHHRGVEKACRVPSRFLGQQSVTVSHFLGQRLRALREEKGNGDAVHQYADAAQHQGMYAGGGLACPLSSAFLSFLIATEMPRQARPWQVRPQMQQAC